MPPLVFRCSFVALGLAWCAGSALAAGVNDPFDTEGALPLKSASALAGRVGDAPCANELPTTVLGVVDAVDLALCNNPQTREAWANARFQAAQLGSAQAGWLPSLDGKLVAGRGWTDSVDYRLRTTSLTLSWLLFDFGTRAANIESARQLLSAASASRSATIQSVFLATLQAYYTAQANGAAVASYLEAEKAAHESYLAADTRYKVGVGTPADRLQAQTAWSQATLNRIKAEGDQRNALGILANAMGFSAQVPLHLAPLPAIAPEAGFAKDIDGLIEAARQRRPDLVAAEAQVKAAQAGIDAARGAGLPTVSLSAVPTWRDAGGVHSNSGTVGLSLSVPLFSGFDNTYKIRAAQAQAEASAAQRDRLAQQVALDVWKAYQSLITATQSVKTANDLVASADESLKVALGRYKAGVGTILDLLNAQSALATARQQRIQTSLDWNIYRATLAQAMGALDYGLLQAESQGKP